MAKNRTNNPKVCYILCYRDPNYIRSQVLIEALQKIEGVELIIVKNKRRGPLRYAETPLKLAYARLRRRPDTFIVGFRGHEVFWLLYPSMAGKKIIFDEFINLHDYLVSEHQKLKEKSLAIRLLDGYIRWIYKKSKWILADTDAHARLSSQIYGVPHAKFKVIPVGADEKTFFPRPLLRSKSGFEVFFFGNLLPLHGLDVMLSAIKLAAERGSPKDIHFTLAGGRGHSAMSKKIAEFIKLNKLSNFVTHHEWIPYNKLPDYIAAADLCLGGPFGGTGQAQRVITGKTYQFLAMARATVIGKGENDSAFNDKKNCLLVEQGSGELLAEAIVWAAEHPKALAEIGEQGRRLYENRFATAIISRKLRDCLND